MADQRPMNPDHLRNLEHSARRLGHVIGQLTPIGTGFMLVLFNFEGPELTYICNAQRDDMVRVLQELIVKLQSGEASQPSHNKN